jgi:hypothetical protein
MLDKSARGWTVKPTDGSKVVARLQPLPSQGMRDFLNKVLGGDHSKRPVTAADLLKVCILQLIF